MIRCNVLTLDHEKAIESLEHISVDELRVEFDHGALLLPRQVFEDFEIFFGLQEAILVLVPFKLEEVHDLVDQRLLQGVPAIKVSQSSQEPLKEVIIRLLPRNSLNLHDQFKALANENGEEDDAKEYQQGAHDPLRIGLGIEVTEANRGYRSQSKIERLKELLFKRERKLRLYEIVVHVLVFVLAEEYQREAKPVITHVIQGQRGVQRYLEGNDYVVGQHPYLNHRSIVPEVHILGWISQDGLEAMVKHFCARLLDHSVV